MLTGEIRAQVDRVWDAFWAGVYEPSTSRTMIIIHNFNYYLKINNLQLVGSEPATWRIVLQVDGGLKEMEQSYQDDSLHVTGTSM